MEKYTPIIGLEIHVELNTETKMFCRCSAHYFGAQPNTHVCPICMGLPGAMPVPNQEAIERTILIAQALNCKINNRFKFDRKNYFYPDLPKGYQISQYDQPIGENGYIDLEVSEGNIKRFGITRVHLEEDTGKSSHIGEDTLLDYNRSSVPLVEIVTEPDFHDAEDVKRFLQELQVIIRYLGVANADMEKGDMRLEPNISVQLTEKLPELPAYKVEVKNINSFNFVKKAVEYEVERHIEILGNGQLPTQETRGWDNVNSMTVSQRSKENAKDYRYFPEPDIPTFEYTEEQLDEILTKMPELPAQKVRRYVDDLGVKFVDAEILTREKEVAKYFEDALSAFNEIAKTDGAGQTVANAYINKKVASDLSPEQFARMLSEMAAPKQTDSGALSEAIEKVVTANEKAVVDYKSGKNPNAVMFLLGQVMKEMKGQADANTVREALTEKLSS